MWVTLIFCQCPRGNLLMKTACFCQYWFLCANRARMGYSFSVLKKTNLIAEIITES